MSNDYNQISEDYGGNTHHPELLKYETLLDNISDFVSSCERLPNDKVLEYFLLMEDMMQDDSRSLIVFGEILSGLGRTYLRFNSQFERALPILKQAVKLAPNHVDAHIALGLCLNGLGESDAALKCYERAVELTADDADVDTHIYVSSAFIQSSKFEEALVPLGRAILADKFNKKVRNNRGHCLNELKRFPEAENDLRLAIASASDDDRFIYPHRLLAVSLLGQGKLDYAMEAVTESIDLATKWGNVTILEKATATKAEIEQAMRDRLPEFGSEGPGS